jgi:pimeloyl-[acyl-carrier protein] methyl ester esterase
MSLHVESIGKGAPLLLIHGWGMHGGVWSEVADKLAADFEVLSVDLPGYGYSKAEKGEGRRAADSLDLIVDELSANFIGPLAVCGWSLGGQIAIRWAAREPAKVKRLILVASTPCFVARENWLFGLEKNILEKFASELEQNHASTLRRFITLQLRGSENEKELLLLLRERLFNRGEPDISALQVGLDILRDVDLRDELGGISQPTLVIAGERDKLTPPQASYYLAEAIPFAILVEIKGAAHAPFLSHPDEFVKNVKSFLNE